jgi:Zn-dependent peptidase ImmA (M78 family)
MAIRRRKIESLVEELLATHQISEAPVPVERIAKAKGARIYYQSLDDDVSGFLFRDAVQTVIGVNTHHAAVRQHFTTAHELGHLLLHDQEQLHVDRDFRIRLRDDVSSQGTDDHEREANLFAATLLMPKRFLEEDLRNEEYVDLFGDHFLPEIAKKYDVSSQALVNRLKNLGYIPE